MINRERGRWAYIQNMFASGLSFAVNEFPFTSHNFSTRMALRDEEAREMDIKLFFYYKFFWSGV